MKLIPYKLKYYKELRGMVEAIYAEDVGELSFDESKLLLTVEWLSQHPQSGAIYLIQNDDSVVGYVIVVFYWSNEYGGQILIVDELYVKPEFRSNGFGTECFSILKSLYHEAIVAMQLEVSPQNKKAKQLYKRLGFKECVNTPMIKVL